MALLELIEQKNMKVQKEIIYVAAILVAMSRGLTLILHMNSILPTEIPSFGALTIVVGGTI